MKIEFVIIVSLFCTLKTSQGDPAADCMKELGFTTEIPNQNVSCFEACMEVKNKNLNADYTINVDFQVERLNKTLTSEQLVTSDNMRTVLTKCKDISKGKNVCEVTKIISSCLMQELKNISSQIQKPE